jgi:hypothetical protein
MVSLVAIRRLFHDVDRGRNPARRLETQHICMRKQIHGHTYYI